MKKMISWHSPKEYQERHRNPNSDPAKLPKPKAKYCKKFKGPHRFGVWYHKESALYKSGEESWFTRVCEGCKRNEYWFPQYNDPDSTPPQD